MGLLSESFSGGHACEGGRVIREPPSGVFFSRVCGRCRKLSWVGREQPGWRGAEKGGLGRGRARGDGAAPVGQDGVLRKVAVAWHRTQGPVLGAHAPKA